jgi:hypothetical protein
MTRAHILRVAIGIAALALFAQSVRVLGIGQVVAGVSRVGWGFLTIVLLSGARDAVRAFAWTKAVESPASLGFLTALRARLAGEALNTLLPMGMIVGEPVKASHVSEHLPFVAAVRALAVEFAFYTASLVLLFAAGFAAFASVAGVAFAVPAIVAASIATAAALWIVRRRSFTSSRRPADILTIVACEIAYQLLSIAELYYTLLLISPVRPTLASAMLLETVSRGVTMIFKMVPLRVGVDEASSSFVAARLHLDPAVGLALALVRKLRMLLWSAVGLALFVRRPARAASPVHVPAAGLSVLTTLLVVLAIGSASAQEATGVVAGSVSVAGADGASLVMPGVTLTLTCPTHEPRMEVSDDRGGFHFGDVAAASAPCSIVADLQGFNSATAVTIAAGETTTVDLQLRLDSLREEVTVQARPDVIDESAGGARVERITSTIMETAPIASDRFQNALPLIPGVVRGPDGLLNINGSRSNQSGLTFNDANGTDPATGEDAIELPIDAVSSVQVRGAAYAPEFGLSSGAATTIETQRAGDAWDVTVNDLEPRVRRRGGEFRGIESWTPRATIGGPIVKGKVSLLESMQYEYSQTRVFSLPPFESDTKLESFESFTRADWMISNANRLTGSAMVSPRKTTYAGLNTFNPQSVTPNIKNHNVLASASDQVIVGDRGVFETRISMKEFDSTIYASQGNGPMVLAPDRNSGSYFNDQERTSRRTEWFNTYSFTPFGPMHFVKVGAGVAYETVDGSSRSRNVAITREDGTLIERIAFVGDGALDANKTAWRGYAQDAWTVTPRLTVQYGARYDYESVVGDVDVAPRASFTLAATGDGRTLVRGGAGIFYNAVPLNVAAFDRMQTRLVTRFADDSATPLGPPSVLENIVESELRAPRSVNWNVEVDREWLKNLFVRAGYQQREERFEPIVDAAASAILLRTDGRSRYRQGQVSARYQFHGADQLVASYTRSSAIGHLNDFNGFFGNVENPVIRPDERGPLPWDAAHRVLVWSSLSLPRGFALFPVIDVRTGFPLSNVDADRNFVGPRNAVGRFPTFASLDAQVTKKLRLFGHNATIGLKVFNITDHINPRDYQGNLASPAFGSFDNSVGRTFRGKWIYEF